MRRCRGCADIASLTRRTIRLGHVLAHGIAVRRRVFALVRHQSVRRARRPTALFPTRANVVLIAVPFRLLRVLVFLPRVAVLAARPPLLVARRTLSPIRSSATFALRRRWRSATVAVGIVLAFGARAVPPSFALTQSLLSRRITRVPKLAALEPFQLRAGMFLAKAVEGGQQLLDVMRSERCRLIVDDDRPVRVSRRHRGQSYARVPQVTRAPEVPEVLWM